MLAQLEEGEKFIPVALFHHPLSKAEQNCSTREKELIAVVLSVNEFRVYLWRKSKLITDHAAVTSLKPINALDEKERKE